MKLNHLLQAILAAFVFSACGSSGSDDPEPTPTPPTPTVTAPTVVSTTPANNASDIETGLTNVQVVYDKDVLLATDASLQPKVTNGTLSGSASVSGKTLSFSVNCPDYETKVTITLPKGLIGVTGALASEYTFSFTTASKPQAAENDATALAKKLGWGWNLGNHFDTSSGEDGKVNQWGYWDNAKPTAALYTNLKKAGASTVRICVTWGNYQNPNDPNWTIDAAFMAEVKQNVEWAEAAGLNVILNIHHDEYWTDIKTAAINATKNDEIKDRIEKTWKQIAEAFKDKGDFLFFESFNELQDGKWGWGDNKTDGGKQYNTLNEWNQLVVNTIRATGSKNAKRWIGVPAYASNPIFALENSFKLPTDAANRIMVSVHFYDPSSFTLTPVKDNISDWGHTGNNNVTGSNEEHVVEIFQKLQEKFIAKNIPVYIGEYGCVIHTTDRANLFRNYYLEYVCRAAHTYNLPVVLWDNWDAKTQGGGDEHHYYFNHNDGTYYSGAESIVKTMIKAATSNDANYTLKSIYNNAPK